MVILSTLSICLISRWKFVSLCLCSADIEFCNTDVPQSRNYFSTNWKFPMSVSSCSLSSTTNCRWLLVDWSLTPPLEDTGTLEKVPLTHLSSPLPRRAQHQEEGGNSREEEGGRREDLALPNNIMFRVSWLLTKLNIHNTWEDLSAPNTKCDAKTVHKMTSVLYKFDSLSNNEIIVMKWSVHSLTLCSG